MKYLVVSTDLHAKLNAMLASSGLKGLSLSKIESLLAECSVDPAATMPITPFRDEQTGLLVPAGKAAEQYSRHWERLPERLSPETFLRTYWSDYVLKHGPWLYAGHLRQHDEPLLAALKYQARLSNNSVDEFLYSCGILTSAFLFADRPPAAAERQCAIYRRLLLSKRAEAARQTANAFLDLQKT